MVDVLPENIRTLRMEKNLTRQDLADALDTSLNIIHKWERGTRFPSPDAIYKMSKLFNVEFSIRHSERHPLHKNAV